MIDAIIKLQMTTIMISLHNKILVINQGEDVNAATYGRYY
jgi:hypothetical protein